MTSIARSVAVGVLLLAAVATVAGVSAGATGAQTTDEPTDNGSLWSQDYFTSARDEWDQRLYGVSRTDDGLLLVGTGRGDLFGDEVVAYAAEATRDGRQTWGRPYMHAATHTRALHDGLKLDDGRYVFAGTTNAPSMTGVGNYLLFDNTGNVHTWRYARGHGAFYDVFPLNTTHVVAVGSQRVWAVETARDDGGRTWTHTPPSAVTLRAGTATDDGVLVAGARETTDGVTAGYVAELGPDGTRHWSRTVGEQSVRLRAITTVGDDIVVGGTDGERGWLARLDADGDALWTRRPFPDGGRVDAVARGPDGTVLAAGETGNGTGVVAQFGAGGRERWRGRHGTEINGLLPVRNGTTVAVGARSNGGHLDAYATRIDFRPPTAAITVGTDRAEVGNTTVTLRANDSTDNFGVARYHWDTDGDGTADRTTGEPILRYVPTETATFRPRVTVEDAGGRIDTATATTAVEVTDTTPPTAVISRPSSGLVAAGKPTTLSAAGSRDNGAILTYRWDFDGDGQPETTTDNETVVHAFGGRNRSYEVGLTVVDGAGQRDTTSRLIETRRNDPPELALSVEDISSQSYDEGYEARLVADVTNAVGNATVRWRLPNGTVLTGHAISFEFRELGTTVEARLADEYGGSDYESVELTRGVEGEVVDRNAGDLPTTENGGTASSASSEGTAAVGSGFGPMVGAVTLVLATLLITRD
ncbi:PKD domain-containing protein [Halorientalis pallida]|uniref:PKD domain-containing protein n=1 Tax=Halorientalis pallida TaxID=2479928 RepID=UPI003C70229D